MKNILFLLLFAPMLVSAQSPLERLEESPRHHEWVTLKDGERELKGFLVYPEVSGNVPVVLVIHENRGLNDWARGMADQIAEMGFIAFAPDLLSEKGPDGGGTSSFESPDDARTALYALDPVRVTADLNACVEYARKIPSGNSKVAVIGFCWGGSQAFRFATNNDQLSASLVCYGSGPVDAAAIERISSPIYGFYGGNDHRVNATIEKSRELMDAAGKFYEPVIYEGAGHGFFRAGESENASEANRQGRVAGLKRIHEILNNL